MTYPVTYPVTVAHYCLMVPGDPHPVETYPRDPEGFGAINAVNRAQHLSANGAAECSVFIGEQFLCRYVKGRRVLDPDPGETISKVSRHM